MERVDQRQEEVGRVGQLLHVDRDHREPALGMVAQVVHDAGLAGPPRGGEHHVSDAEPLPQIGQKRLAEPEVDRIDGRASVEFGDRFHFHRIIVVNQIRCMKHSTSKMLYVKCVVKLSGEPIWRTTVRFGSAQGHHPAAGQGGDQTYRSSCVLTQGGKGTAAVPPRTFDSTGHSGTARIH